MSLLSWIPLKFWGVPKDRFLCPRSSFKISSPYLNPFKNRGDAWYCFWTFGSPCIWSPWNLKTSTRSLIGWTMQVVTFTRRVIIKFYQKFITVQQIFSRSCFMIRNPSGSNILFFPCTIVWLCLPNCFIRHSSNEMVKNLFVNHEALTVTSPYYTAFIGSAECGSLKYIVFGF